MRVVHRAGLAAVAFFLAACQQGGSIGVTSDDYTRPMASPIADDVTHPAGRLALTIRLEGRPFGLAVTPSGSAIVSQLDAAKVTMIALDPVDATGVQVGNTPTGVAAIGDRWALVTNQFSGNVSVVNVVTQRETSVIPVPHAPFRVLADREGEMAYATINEGLVMFMDLADRQVKRTVAVAHAPNGLAIHGDRLYVSSMTGEIAVIDRMTGAVERTIAIPEMLQDLAIDRAGRHMFVASESDPYIRIVSLETATVTDSIHTGESAAPTPGGGGSGLSYPIAGGTFGLALSPDETQLYATSQANLLIFDVATRSRVLALPLGGNLRRVAFNASGTAAVVTDESGAVHLIK